jgi:hypothetical protein
LTKAVVVPSCAMIPLWLQPPSCMYYYLTSPLADI